MIQHQRLVHRMIINKSASLTSNWTYHTSFGKEVTPVIMWTYTFVNQEREICQPRMIQHQFLVYWMITNSKQGSKSQERLDALLEYVEVVSECVKQHCGPCLTFCWLYVKPDVTCSCNVGNTWIKMVGYSGQEEKEKLPKRSSILEALESIDD
jgi:hypothetical protein